jgi:hypothetical protein
LLLFGFPDTLFGRGNILLYLFENIFGFPSTTVNFFLGMNPLLYLFTRHYPVIFGSGLLILFVISIGYFSLLLFKKGIKKIKIEIFILFTFFVFLISILPLQLFAGGNKSLVLLPFMVLIISLMRIRPNMRFLIFFICISQLFVSLLWVYLKIQKSPQEKASYWVESNIKKGEIIGLENIPIYQAIPDTFQKEFYYQQYGVKQNYKYSYQLIDSKSKSLPTLLVISNGDIETKAFRKTAKTDLMKRIEAEGYHKVISFAPDLKYLQSNDIDFFLSWIVAIPNEIIIFQK